jgi:hypothetical protein
MAEEIRGSTIISEGDGKVLDITMKKNYLGPHVWIGATTIRRALGEFAREEGSYVFMRTSANPEAAKLINDSQAELSKIRFGYVHDDFEFCFDSYILERYIGALEHLVKQRGVKHMSYPIVQHNRHPDAALLPYIHVVRDGEGVAEDFALAVNSLNSDDAYDFIRSKEAIQNYNMGSVNLLRDRGVAPLRLEDRVWNVDAQVLRDAMDFLLQFEYHRDEPHHCCCGDDW